MSAAYTKTEGRAQSRNGGAIREFLDFPLTGCSEAEAGDWLTAHILDFDGPLRNQLGKAFNIEIGRGVNSRDEGGAHG